MVLNLTTGLQVLLGGFLTGCIYALVAVGLALIWGLMGLVNFAHGDFLMIGMYVSFWLWALVKMDPFIGLPINAIVMFCLGVFVYFFITKKVLRAERTSQIFATFGLAIALRAGAQFFWSPDYRMINNPILGGVMKLGELTVCKAHLIGGIVALGLSMGLYYMILRTDFGRALRATAEDRHTAEIMGINTDKVFAIAWGIGGLCVGIGGALMASYYYIYPDVGLMFSTLAPAIVALGGFGNIPGAVLAAILVGIVQTGFSFFMNPAFKLAMVYALYLIVVIFRPQGLLGRR